MSIEIGPLGLSFTIAMICTGVLFIVGIVLGYVLAYSRSTIAMLLRACIMLPLVLPPSVLGFYFLVAWSPNNFFGAFLLNHFNIRLVFSFWGLVIASVLAGLPFMVNPILSGFEALPSSLKEASSVLGKSRLETLIRVLLPSIKPSLLTGILMTFIHTFGEFGLVLMLGGKIPGKTITASIALYDYVESLQYREAHLYAAFLVVCSLSTLIALFAINKKLTRVIT